MKKFFKVTAIVFFSVAVIIGIPFVIEAILFEEKLPLLSKSIRLGRDDWFAFMGSYLGSLGTVFLGGLALWQSKRYKDDNDKTEKEFIELQNKIRDLVDTNNKLTAENIMLVENSGYLQNDIKNLVSSNAGLQQGIKDVVDQIPELIEKNTENQREMQELLESNKSISDGLLKIQEAIFIPRLNSEIDARVSTDGSFFPYMDEDKDVFAYGFIQSDAISHSTGRNWKEAMQETCSFIAFSLRNTGEKDIFDFTFEDMRFSNGVSPVGTLIRNSSTIKKQQMVRFLLAIPRVAFDEFITRLNENRGATLLFSLKNPIGDTFILTLTITQTFEDEFDGRSYMFVYSAESERINSLWDWRKENMNVAK